MEGGRWREDDGGRMKKGGQCREYDGVRKTTEGGYQREDDRG